MKRRLLPFLLLLALTLSLVPGARAAERSVTEVHSAAEFCEAIQPGAQTLRAGGETADVLLLADVLGDDFGAVRVVRWAKMHQYVLQYADRAAAERAVGSLRAVYGADCCWLDTPDQGAAVLDEPDGTVPAEPSLTWNVGAMGLDYAFESAEYRAHTDGKAVKVAVLDTGADMGVSALKARGISPDSYDLVHNTDQLTDVKSGNAAGHGTTIATLLCRLLPKNAELMLLRVCDDGGSARSEVLGAGIVYALEHGADVINISLGWEGKTPDFNPLRYALERAETQGVPVICAAGNTSADVSTCYPANHEKTMAISAIGKDKVYQLFSNYGDAVDFTAPGSDIAAIEPGGQSVLCKGTSYSAPHVTAAAADMLLLEKLSPKQLYEALRACSEDLGDEGRDRLYGWGLPQIAGWLEQHLQHVWDSGRTSPLATAAKDGARVYACTVCGDTKSEKIPATKGEVHNPFWDVAADSYYAAPVTWAVANDITDGTDETRFSPAAACSRAHIVTFLWRAAGCPAPESGASPFADVQNRDSWYYQPVLWAVQQGITDGVDETHFAPDQTVTRAQAVTFLWRMHEKPGATAASPFVDVADAAYYADAVRWAVDKAITDGTDETHFSPALACTRAQIVTFLYRDLGV